MNVRFHDMDKTYMIKGDQVEKFRVSRSKTSSIPLIRPEQVRGGRRRYKRTARNMREWGGCRGRRYEVGGGG